jgi:hypothetical protein
MSSDHKLPGLRGIDPRFAQYELQISVSQGSYFFFFFFSSCSGESLTQWQFLPGQTRSNYLCLPRYEDRTVDWVNSGGVYRVTSVPTAAAYRKSLVGSGVDISHCAGGVFEGVKSRLDRARYSHPNDPKGIEAKLSRFTIPDGSEGGLNVNYQAYVTKQTRK